MYSVTHDGSRAAGGEGENAGVGPKGFNDLKAVYPRALNLCKDIAFLFFSLRFMMLLV